jgi:hypothetical protein
VEPTYLSDYGPDSRIVSYVVEALNGGQWQQLLSGDSPKQMLYTVKQASAERLRLSVRGAGKTPGIAEFGIYKQPD